MPAILPILLFAQMQHEAPLSKHDTTSTNDHNHGPTIKKDAKKPVTLSEIGPEGNRRSHRDVTNEKDNKPKNVAIDYVSLGFWVNLVLVLATLLIAICALVQAVAAKRSADALINSERAWIIPKMESMPNYEPNTTLRLVCQITNVGRTVARVIRISNTARSVKTEGELEEAPTYGEPVKYPGSGTALAPNGGIPVFFEVASADMSKPEHGEEILYIYGRIEYRDISEVLRITQFCFRFNPTTQLGKSRGFHVGGPEGYNKYT